MGRLKNSARNLCANVGIAAAGVSISNHRPAVRALLYSSVLSGGLLLVNGAAYAAPCTGGIDGANSTSCVIGTTNATLDYSPIIDGNLSYVNGNFSLTLEDHDVNGATDGISFSGVTGGDGLIELRGDSDVDGNNGYGINARAVNSNTTIEVQDTSSVTGSQGGILVVSGGVVTGGNVTINTQATTTVTGESLDGIYAVANAAGNVTIDAQGGVTGNGAGNVDGIFAFAISGTVGVTTGTGAITGSDEGIDVFAASNTATVTTGAGVVTGTAGDGINARGASVIVGAGGNVTGTGASGISAAASVGTVSVTTAANTTVTGSAGNGINAVAPGAVTVDPDGNVSGSTNGINAVSQNGLVTVTTLAGTTITGTNDDGINAEAQVTGNVVVTALSAVTGNDTGIDANAVSGTVNVTTGVAAVIANAGTGIAATASGAVTVGTGGNVTGTGGDGILAISQNGNVTVTTAGAAGTLVSGTGGVGIFANAVNTGNVDVDAQTAVTGSGVGISANATSGTVEVTTGAAAVVGQNGSGIEATASGLITVGTGGNVTGTNGYGIIAVSQTGGVNVTTNGAAGTLVSGLRDNGIDAEALGSGNVDVEVHTAVTGRANGINASATSGTVEVTTDTAAILGQLGHGINATASGLVTVGTGGNVTGIAGINAVAQNGNVNVTTNGAAGTLISGTASAGIFANAAVTGNTDVDVHTAVTGATNGIDANATSGTVEVTTDTAAITGNAGDGIQATASGNATVQTKGNVTGTGGSGINAQSTAGGNVQVTTNLADPLVPATVVTGTAGAGILAVSTGAGTVTIVNDTFTKGAVTGIDAVSGTGAIQITNTRVIANTSNLESDLAIRTVGGPTTIDNNTNGGIIGRVETSASNDTLNNRFFWLTNGTSDFGGGANDAVNNFYYIFAGNQTGASETTTFDGLENLNNNALGHIQLIDQAAGDGSNFTDLLRTSGNYNGNGGDLGVDAFLGGPGSFADVLSVGGNVTGVTEIFVNDTNAGPGGFNPNGILVAHADGTTTAADFVLANGPIDKGLFFYDLLFNAAAGDHLLVGLPDREVFETLAAVSSSQEIWRESADAWSTRQENLRDVLATRQVVTGVADPAVVEDDRPMGSLWVSALGSWAERDNDASFSILNGSFEFDTSYKQDIYGMVGGADFRADMGGDSSMLFGVMGGYVDSKLNFDESSTSIDTSGATLGAYASLMNGGFFANVLFKADLLNMDYTAGSLATDDNDDANVTTWGVRGDLGYRFGDSLFVEPMLSVDGISTKIDEFTIGGVDIDAGTNESFRGGAGLRAGYGGDSVRASATARVWNVFSTDNEVEILAGVPLGITDDGMEGVYGDVSGQIDVSLSTSATVYLKGGILFSDDVTKPNASGGFAFYW